MLRAHYFQLNEMNYESERKWNKSRNKVNKETEFKIGWYFCFSLTIEFFILFEWHCEQHVILRIFLTYLVSIINAPVVFFFAMTDRSSLLRIFEVRPIRAWSEAKPFISKQVVLLAYIRNGFHRNGIVKSPPTLI